MSLRGRVPDAEATYEDPVLGVNLHSSEEDLQRGETSLMQNMVFFGGLVSRTGSSLITTSQVAASFGVRGGHKFYFGGSSPDKDRLIAYDTFISIIADNGTETKIYNTQTSDLNTHFTTWPITDKVYIANGTDPLIAYDGTTAQIVGGVNIRTATYEWNLSGSGTTEYYLQLNGGGDPSIADPTASGGVFLNGAQSTKGVLSSLAAGEWAYGNADTLGFDTVYVRLADGTDPDLKASGWVVAMQAATDIPGVDGVAATSQVIGLVDRLFGITANGIERTDPRDPTIWSNDSSWATFRPSQSGVFKAHVPHTITTVLGQPINGALAITESGYYFYSGTDFGDDVTNATPSAGEDGSINFIDFVGGFGPKSMTSVPGVGTFWLTNNLDVFYVPSGSTQGRIIGTRIVNSGNSNTKGLESLRIANGDDAWLVYYEPYLMLGFPIDSDNHPTRQYWLDMSKFRLESRVPIWYGPMIGQTVSSVWVENQQGDNGLAGGEGDTSVGVFVYNLRVANVYADKSGATSVPLDMQVSTYLKSGGAPSREKYVQGIEIEMNTIAGNATCDIADLTGTILANLPVERTFAE